MERHFSDEAGSILPVLFRFVQKQKRKIRKKNDSRVYEHVGTAGNSEYPSDEVDRLWNVGEKKKSSTDAEKH